MLAGLVYYLELIEGPVFPLMIKSLENKGAKIKLLNVRKFKMDNLVDEKGAELLKATVFFPLGKEQFFLNRINQYQKEDTRKGNPKHQGLIETISGINQALLSSFWTGNSKYIQEDEPVWCEVWIGDDQDISVIIKAEKDLLKSLHELQIENRTETIEFPELRVFLVKASHANLVELIARCEYITEIKKATEANVFFTELENKDQIQWAKELLERLTIEDTQTTIGILDSGLNNGSKLLNGIV